MSTTNVLDFEWLEAGHCLALDAFTIKGGAWRVARFPAGFGLFRHPAHGWVLFDTGYAPHFLTASHCLPYRLYRYATPVRLRPDESALSQLSARGLLASDIKTVIISHLHADHIAGLLDFPQATLVASREGYDVLSPLRGIAAVRSGYLPGLLPADFTTRARWIEDQPDIFGDGSLQMLQLPGHAPGQYGALLQTTTGPKFLCADACWQSKSYRDQIDLPTITHAFLTHDPSAFRESLNWLHHYYLQNPEVEILPSHCKEHLPS